MGKLQSKTAAILPLCGIETVPLLSRFTGGPLGLAPFGQAGNITRGVSARGITPSFGLLFCLALDFGTNTVV